MTLPYLFLAMVESQHAIATAPYQVKWSCLWVSKKYSSGCFCYANLAGELWHVSRGIYIWKENLQKNKSLVINHPTSIDSYLALIEKEDRKSALVTVFWSNKEIVLCLLSASQYKHFISKDHFGCLTKWFPERFKHFFIAFLSCSHSFEHSWHAFFLIS